MLGRRQARDRLTLQLPCRLERALITDGNLKRVKAQVMKTFNDLPVTAQEREAYEASHRVMSTYP
jgi:hypothetical protein